MTKIIGEVQEASLKAGSFTNVEVQCGIDTDCECSV
jgi:hypothetical protein